MTFGQAGSDAEIRRRGEGGGRRGSAGGLVLDLCSAYKPTVRTERRVRKREEAEQCEPSRRLVSSRLGKRKKNLRTWSPPLSRSLRTLCCLGHACPSRPAPRPSTPALTLSHPPIFPPSNRGLDTRATSRFSLSKETRSLDTVADMDAHATASTARSPAAPLRIIRLSSHLRPEPSQIGPEGLSPSIATRAGLLLKRSCGPLCMLSARRTSAYTRSDLRWPARRSASLHAN